MLSSIPNVTRLNPLVTRILGQNPGPRTLEGTNSYLVGQPDLPRILIDTTSHGPGYSKYLNLLGAELRQCKTACPLSAVVITHWHTDHCQGTKDVLDLAKQIELENTGNVNQSNIIVYKFLNGPDLSKLGYFTGQLTHCDHDTLIPVQLSNSDVKLNLRSVHTPGHSVDHLCLWLEKNDQPSCLFTGDLIIGSSGTSIEDLDVYLYSLNQLRNCIENLEVKNSLHLYPGHGSEILDSLKKIDNYIDNRMSRIKKIEQFLIENSSNNWYDENQLFNFVYPNLDLNLYITALNNLRQSLFWLKNNSKQFIIIIRNQINQNIIDQSYFHNLLKNQLFDSYINKSINFQNLSNQNEKWEFKFEIK